MGWWESKQQLDQNESSWSCGLLCWKTRWAGPVSPTWLTSTSHLSYLWNCYGFLFKRNLLGILWSLEHSKQSFVLLKKCQNIKNVQTHLLLLPESLSTKEKDKHPCCKNFHAMCHRYYRITAQAGTEWQLFGFYGALDLFEESKLTKILSP